MDLHGHSLLKETDLTAGEFLFLVELARQLRADKRRGVTGRRLAGRSIALISEKTSTRTRSGVLGRMFDGIEYRGFAQASMDTFGEFAGVPVWNGLSDAWHPTQMLADILT